MEQSENRIEELKSQITDCNAELKQIYEEAGEIFIKKGESAGENEPLAELVGKVGEEDSRLSTIESRMDDLRNSYKRISEITEREKSIGEEYSSLEKENRKLYPSIGKAAYIELKGDLKGEYSKQLTALSQMEENVRALEDEIFRLDSKGGKKGLIESLKRKGNSLMLKSRKKSALSSMESQYGKLGEKISRKDLSFFENLKDDSVSSFIDHRREMDKLDGEINELKEENARLEKHLKTEFNSSKRKKAEEKLQSDRDLVLSRKMAGLNELGQFLYGEKIDAGSKELKDLFSSADGFNRTIGELNEEIERCKAELEIEKLDEEIDDMKKNIKELELTIEKCNGDISEFNKEIKRARAEIRKLRKLADNGKDAEETET